MSVVTVLMTCRPRRKSVTEARWQHENGDVTVRAFEGYDRYEWDISRDRGATWERLPETSGIATVPSDVLVRWKAIRDPQDDPGGST